jgi:hypothetical protein
MQDDPPMSDAAKKWREGTVARIVALMAKTVDNGCTVSEAAEAARKVDELLAKYEIDLDARAATKDPLLTATQAAEMLGIVVQTFWKNVASGWLPPPTYVAPKAPRWRLSWLTCAMEAKRALPREAVAERRARKLARTKVSIATTELNA